MVFTQGFSAFLLKSGHLNCLLQSSITTLEIAPKHPFNTVLWVQFKTRAWSLTVFHLCMANDWQVQAGGGAVGRNCFLTPNP